ncbi:YrrS family protein [Listeria costaricensis]|uniref:YrrS family protein n=1 Tax=Listeria costaricensis TaxID=2026604 RepID=UPI000C086848|nr:YrrS family protein [Listeria costaricensis]
MARQKKTEHSRRVEQNNIEATRAKQNSQRKRTNLILNILIIVVSLLIVASLYVVFIATDPGPDQNDTQTASSTQKKEDAAKSDQSAKEDKEQATEKDSATTEEQESSDPNVSKVISKDWKAVGTKQSGDHVNSYEMNSTDWNEKIQAFSEATDISADDMTIWYVGRGADPATQSVGTVSAKSTPDQAYRVYITWRDGEGWQPTKVEVLKSNDKR